jgi:hypothetical protein
MALEGFGKLSDAIAGGLSPAPGHHAVLYPPTLIVQGGWDGREYGGLVSPADSWAIAQAIYSVNDQWWTHVYGGRTSRPFPPSLLTYPGGHAYTCVPASADMAPWTTAALLPDQAFPRLPLTSCGYQPLNPDAPPRFPKVRSRVTEWLMEMTQP